MPKSPRHPLEARGAAEAAFRETGDYLDALSLEDHPPLLRASTVSELLNVSPQTIYALIRCGELTAVRIGCGNLRIFRESVRDFLRRKMAEE